MSHDTFRLSSKKYHYKYQAITGNKHCQLHLFLEFERYIITLLESQFTHSKDLLRHTDTRTKLIWNFARQVQYSILHYKIMRLLFQTEILIDFIFNQVYNTAEIMFFVQLLVVLVFFSRGSATPYDTAIEKSTSPVARNDAGSFSKLYLNICNN